MDDIERRALKKIIEVRSKDKGSRSRRSISESIRIGELAKIRFSLMFEVIEWNKERRILKLRHT
ncbi:MAG: hypothetical protein ABWW65_05370 [Thermoprotei archaeon]